MDPKCVKLDQKSEFGHVRTYCWLNELRNTQGEIYGTYLGNIYIYGIYKECIRHTHKYLWYKMIRNTGAAFGGGPLSLSSWLLYSINIYGYSLYVSYMFHIYFLNMFLMCFLIYGVKHRSGHDRSQSFGPILHVSDPKLKFWGNFILVLHGFAWRS